MRQLKSTIIIVLFLTSLLILNTIGVFSYHQSYLSCQATRTNIAHFTVKYQNLPSKLWNHAILYLDTQDEQYRVKFYKLYNAYYNDNYIPIDSSCFSGSHSAKHPSIHATIATQVQLLNFNKKESALYEEFLVSYEEMLDKLHAAVEEKEILLITTLSYQQVYSRQYHSLVLFKSNYTKRLNDTESLILNNETLLETTVIFLSILLFFMAILLFYLLARENLLNLYYRKLYTTIVENINVGLSIQDKEGRYEYMNAKYKELLNIPLCNALGKTPVELCNQEIAGILKTYGTDQSERHLSLHILQENRYMEYDHIFIFDEKKQKKYIDLLHDTTQTEKMQKQLREQLQEIQYHSRAKDAFLANISHEIKTPINAIVGMTYFLKETQLSHKQSDLVLKIENASNMLLSIINDVLDLSKIKANSLCLSPSAFYLTNLIQSVEDMFISQIQRKNLIFESHYNFDRDLCLHLDRTRLLQVLVNIIGNACKFTDKGHIVLFVEATPKTSDTVNLQFCIEDTGIGILPEDIDQLFQEFKQVENPLTKKHNGTGLGLSICKHIVEAMGGKLWVTSNFGSGSKFYFTIPAEKASKQQANAIEQFNENAKKINGNGAKVLLVEDTEINREVVTSLLQDINLICDTACDGLKAIELCKEHPRDYYKIILMDIHMPRMDGYTAANILKNKLHVKAPILAVTATSLNESTKLQYRNIIDGFLLKPFKIETFYRTIYKFLLKAIPDLEKTPTIQPTYAESENKNPLTDETQNTNSKYPFAGKEEAIHNIGGMENIYYKHVEKFQQNYCNSTDEIEEFLVTDNQEEAKRLAHSVKGLAGTLGMTNLHKAATILDKNISTKSTQINTSLEQYRQALIAVLADDPHKDF